MKTRTTVLIFALSLALVSGALADDEKSESAGRFIGASSSIQTGCLPDGADVVGNPLYGVAQGCTWHDLQKYGSMGRQITVDPIFHALNHTWTDSRSNWLGANRAVKHCGFFGGAIGGPCAVHVLWASDGQCNETPTIVNATAGLVVVALQANQLFCRESKWLRTYMFKNWTAGLPDFSGFGGVNGTGNVPDSAWNGYLSGDANAFIWPQIAYTAVGGTQVAHLVISSDRTDDDNTALYLRKIGSADWETVMELGPAGFHRSFIVTNSQSSERVAIAFSGGRGNGGPPISRYNGSESGKRDNDLYVIISEDAGASWGPLQNITQRIDDSPGGFAPQAKLSAVFDENDVYHVIWQATSWPGYDGAFTTSSRMYHWDEGSAVVRIAAEGNWTPTDCEPGFQQLNIDNPQLSYCSNKLYLTFTAFAPVPFGKGDDCHARAYSGDPNGAANGNIYLTVSENSGFTWDSPRALISTYTPNCDTIGGSGDLECNTAVWHSATRYGIDITDENFFAIPDFTERIDPAWAPDTGLHLFVQYVDDHIPGAAVLGEGGWTDNPLRAFRFGCVAALPSARLASSLPQGVVVSDSIEILSANITVSWILENIGAQDISDLAISITEVSPIGFASVTGFDAFLPAGSANSDTGLVHLALSTLGDGDTGSARIVVSGSFDESPMTFDFNFTAYDPSCCVVAGDADNGGSYNIGDITFIIARIFSGGVAPECCEAADYNCDGAITIQDVVGMIQPVFYGAPNPTCCSKSFGTEYDCE